MEPKAAEGSSAEQPATSSAGRLYEPVAAATRSAEQPASSTAEQAATSQAATSSAEQPALSQVYKFHGYNLGWNYTDKQRSAQWLSEELVRLWNEHGFHAIGLSEVFEIEYPRTTLLEVDARRQ